LISGHKKKLKTQPCRSYGVMFSCLPSLAPA